MGDEKAKSNTGYLPLGIERKLTTDGNWDFVQTEYGGTTSDLPYEKEVFRDPERFPDGELLFITYLDSSGV
jgi:hypothetical protein